jgi:hypothetical protein
VLMVVGKEFPLTWWCIQPPSLLHAFTTW